MNWKSVLVRPIARRAAAALVVGLAVSLAAPGAFATEPDELKAGPPVGAKIPHDLSTLDANGQHADFKSLAHKRGLLILFNRSVDW